MPNKKISQLNSIDQLFGDEKLLITQGGVNKTSTVPVLGTKLNSDIATAVSGLNTQNSGYASSARASIAGIGSELSADIGSLHRSPGAVTAMFVYDTSKDSDGGAWTEKCSSTSWYNETLSGNWLGAVTGTSLALCETAARAVSGATTGDYYQASFDGKFYSLNSGSGYTEVFRGNKRSFPKLTGIVAEANNVTIYDLTESGRPMWMRFVNTGAMNIGTISSLANSIVALNSRLFICGSTGFFDVDFFKDTLTRCIQNSTSQQKYISTRASNTLAVTISSYKIPGSSRTNVVAATYLPTSPIDPISGLRSIFIIIGSHGGASPAIVKEDGMTVISGSANYLVRLSVEGSRIWYAGNAWNNTTETTYVSVVNDIRKLTSAVVADYSYNNTRIPYTPYSLADIVVANRLIKNTNGVYTVKENPSSSGSKTIFSRLTNTYNTGHQIGDIRRTYLSDVDVGVVNGTELVVNGTFNSNVDGWEKNAGTLTWDNSGALVLTVGSSDTTTYAYQSVPTVIGKRYYVQVTHVSTTNGSYIRVGTSAGDTTYLSINFPSSGTTYSTTFVANTTTTYISLVAFRANARVLWDNVSLKEVCYDRSYKTKTANINGTLSKSPVATNAQLVGYSGFSNSNYIREPASTDLDFDTGEWSASAWFKPQYANINANLLSYPEAFATANIWDAFSSTVTTDTTLTTDPNGGNTADLIIPAATNTNGKGIFRREAASVYPADGETVTSSIYVKSAGINYVYFGHGRGTPSNGYGIGGVGVLFDLTSGQGTLLNTNTTWYANAKFTSEKLSNGWWRLSVTSTAGAGSNNQQIVRIQGFKDMPLTSSDSQASDGTSGFYIWGAKFNFGDVPGVYVPGQTTVYDPTIGACLFARSASTGASIYLSMGGSGNIIASVLDSSATPVTRTITSSNTYRSVGWSKVDVTYTTNGTLSLYINGQAAATAVTGSALASLSNSNATLTIGNNHTGNNQFSGSLAQVKLSATVPTDEQRVWMYEQERAMFQPGAQVCLPSSNSVTDLTYDNLTDTWIAAQSTHISEWKGLIRTSYRKPASGSFDKLSAASGVRLMTRSSWGVDIETLPLQLKKEFYSSTDSAINNQNTTTFDFDAATSQTDFVLPVGYTAQAVFSAGVQKFEGISKDYTRLFDGFRETIRFETAPGANVWVKIRAVITQ